MFAHHENSQLYGKNEEAGDRLERIHSLPDDLALLDDRTVLLLVHLLQLVQKHPHRAVFEPDGWCDGSKADEPV